MDFTFTPEQDEAADLAAKILGAEVTPARQREVESQGDRFDRDLWRTLAEAGLLGLHLPGEYGGSDLGLIELGRVLVEVGRVVAPVPLASHGAASAVLAECGSPDQRRAWLPGAVAGELVLSVAISEDHVAVPTAPTVHAEPDGDRWRLTGTKTQVRAGTTADAFLLTATVGGEGVDVDDRVGVFLVSPGDGVTLEQQRVIGGDVTALVVLDGVAAERVGDAAAVERLHQVAIALTCAEQLGVVEGALAQTADYATTREQFARPIGSFQAVSQRLADGYIDTLCLRLTLWQALWRLAEHVPAATEVAIAKLWAADAGHRLAHTAVHVHGGVGIDLDGVTHRYFTAAKRLEFGYGGATEQALAVGASLAARGHTDARTTRLD